MIDLIDWFMKWLIIFVCLIVVIGLPVYLIYLAVKYKNNYIHKKTMLENKVEELEVRVKELERKTND